MNEKHQVLQVYSQLGRVGEKEVLMVRQSDRWLSQVGMGNIFNKHSNRTYYSLVWCFAMVCMCVCVCVCVCVRVCVLAQVFSIVSLVANSSINIE